MTFKIQQLKPEQFPTLLDEINDAPKQLWYRGEIPNWDEYKFLAVVGSRKYSRYGKQVCENLIKGLFGYRIIIVSGLALGIDSVAHTAALDVGLKTISVPGSGLDKKVLHPRANHKLADRIVESGGVLLSECEPSVPAGLHTFPSRNRIMAGMCSATLVIEAAERSGTLITARLATEYDREVLVVPHDITRVTSKGVHQFLKLGATPVTESEDILKVLGFEIATNNESSEQPKQKLELSKQEQKIFDILSRDNLTRDELKEKLDQSVTQTNILLSAMEIKGIIKEELGTVRLS